MATKSENDSRIVRIAEGRGNLGKVKNRAIGWGQLRKELSDPTVTKERFKAYLQLPKEEQDKLKNVNGYWIGGHCEDGRRAAANIYERDIITFDCDDLPAALLDDIELGLHGLAGIEHFVHSTRKHTDAKPRIRVVVLLARAIPADHYHAAARILAAKLDPSMDAVDDVSFRVAQMMFKPSRSRDGAWFFAHFAGRPLDAEQMLDDWGDWRDHTNLPYSERQGQKRPSAAKAEDPTTKRGVVGAFCRAFDVETAIAEFLPDVYVPSDAPSGKPRYSYAAGSTTGGVVVEDGGLFIYSHHSTDPCGDRLCNAFDMVRLHLFHDKDEGKDESSTSPSDMPSYKAMAAFAQERKEVTHELAADRYDAVAMFRDVSDEFPDDAGAGDEADEFDDLEADDDDLDDVLGPKIATPKTSPASTAPAWKDWSEKLDFTDDGVIRPTLHNAALIVQNDVRLHGAIARNELTGRVVARRSLRSKLSTVPDIIVDDTERGLPWEDLHDYSIRAVLEAPNGKGQAGYGMKVSDRDLHGAVLLAANCNSFHPFRDYLERQEWDGKQRLETLLVRFLGTPDTPYHRAAIRLTLIAAVARTYEPGCKFDSSMFISGKQGIGKSTFVKILGRHKWFAELHGDLSNPQRMAEQLSQGAVIMEHPEIAGFRRADVEESKAFQTRTHDDVRLAYDRRVSSLPRRCIFVGTTNDEQYLKDPTGNRRYWPIRATVPHIDFVGLEREMDQVWAEAAALYHGWRKTYPRSLGDLPLHMTGAAAKEAYNLQESHRLESAEEGTAGVIQAWLDRPVPVGLITGDRSFDAFEDLDTAHGVALRMTTCLKQIWVEALGGDDRSYTPANNQALGRAMRFVDGWTLSGRRARTAKYGVQRLWIRNDASVAERDAGYRAIDEADDLGDVL